MNGKTEGLRTDVISDFGQQWRRFDQASLADEELKRTFQDYFHRFPWDQLPADAEGFDVGCGTGRWAKLVVPRVGLLHCIDPSELALQVAGENLAEFSNCRFHLASAEALPLRDNSMDFGYSLGVLHHLRDTQKALSDCVAKLKPGAPFLLYLYYAFDNRPAWYAAIWWLGNQFRRLISHLPFPLKVCVTQVIAALIYFPLAWLARALEHRSYDVTLIPLAAYRHKSFYTMRTDALDRFGTKLEHRFSAKEIRGMMTAEAGLSRITFNDQPPYWCALGYKQI